MEGQRILWICDAPPLSAAEKLGQRSGWTVEYRLPGPALESRSGDPAAIVLNFPLTGWKPAELLDAVRRAIPGVPVLIRDPQATLSDAVRLARLGAWQVLTDSDDPTGLIEQAVEERRARDLAQLSDHVVREDWERLLVGESPEIRQVQHLIRMVGSRRATVLITGETGTGKEVAARALHLAGARRRGPFVAVNCSALPENLLEAELFGHVRGAFTGAVQNRTGRFEQAQGGTLLLDEIGELPMDLQVKLLRVLQEREFQKLGSSETIRVDARVVAATNCDLFQKIQEGAFREDLYYRLNVVPVHMPALRPSDIPLLAAHLLSKICRLEEIPAKSLDRSAVEKLSAYSWPGNVRQLENAIEMAVAMGVDRPLLAAADFTLPEERRIVEATGANSPVVELPEGGIDFEQTLAAIERSILEQALRKTGGNKKAAAQMLRLKRTTLSAKVRSLASTAWN
jgi:DNA-binding NtrC family response regulator